MIVAPNPLIVHPNSTTANRSGPLLLWPERAVEEPKYYWSLLPFTICLAKAAGSCLRGLCSYQAQDSACRQTEDSCKTVSPSGAIRISQRTLDFEARKDPRTNHPASNAAQHHPLKQQNLHQLSAAASPTQVLGYPILNNRRFPAGACSSNHY